MITTFSGERPEATRSTKPDRNKQATAQRCSRPQAGVCEPPREGTKKTFAGEKKPFAGQKKPSAGNKKPFAGKTKPVAGKKKP